MVKSRPNTANHEFFLKECLTDSSQKKKKNFTTCVTVFYDLVIVHMKLRLLEQSFILKQMTYIITPPDRSRLIINMIWIKHMTYHNTTRPVHINQYIIVNVSLRRTMYYHKNKYEKRLKKNWYVLCVVRYSEI